MTDLVMWLRAQLDEDERMAMAATVGPWDTSGPHTIAEWGIYSEARGWRVASAAVNSYPDSEFPKLRGGIDGDEANDNAAHIARHDPARVLREVAAHRAIMDAHAEAATFYNAPMNRHLPAGEAHGLWTALRHLAAVYVDRDGYRPEWAPDA